MLVERTRNGIDYKAGDVVMLPHEMCGDEPQFAQIKYMVHHADAQTYLFKAVVNFLPLIWDFASRNGS